MCIIQSLITHLITSGSYVIDIWSLQGLTPAEEMLVSAVMPILSIYGLPLGQYGYTGHIINLPQDVVTIAHSLPRLPSEVDVLIVWKDYQQGQMSSTIITLSLIQSLSCIHMTCQKLVSNYTRHWHPHSLRSPKWRLHHPSIIIVAISKLCTDSQCLQKLRMRFIATQTLCTLGEMPVSTVNLNKPLVTPSQCWLDS